MTTEREQTEERAGALLAVVRLASRIEAPPDVILAAIVEHLGITPEMVEPPTEHHARARIDALSVLLRAAGREVRP